MVSRRSVVQLDRKYDGSGHALTKHGAGQRVGLSTFPPLEGNAENINGIAQSQIEEILGEESEDS